ncbi:aminomethyl transferase family protein, partial [Mesorhizobium sp. M2D.F.Ca.ET.178.01.1.1]
AVTGEGAAAWLDRMLACKLPKRGRMTLAPMLKNDGRLIGDFTLANIDDGEWFIAGSGIAEQYHMRWFEAHLPKNGSVRIEALGQ